MPAVIGSLPLLLYIALMMFLVGLVVLLWSLNPILFGVCVGIIGLLVMFYIATTILPLLYVSCPYKTLATQALQYGLSTLYSWVTKTLCVPQLGLKNNGVKSVPFYMNFKQQEAQMLETIGGQLDAEALAWLVHHSNDQTTVKQALKATAGLSPHFKGFQTVSNMEMASNLL
jgi:hypothetical protein